MPTDRGYVMVTELAQGYKVEVCANDPEGNPSPGIFATHTGVAEVEVATREPFKQRGNRQYSAKPLEVFVSRDDGRLYVADIKSSSS